MVYKMICDCNERMGIKIDSDKLFQELKVYFNQQTENGIFKEEINKTPFRIWTDGDKVVESIATKWYRCSVCNCLWEFQYPDFPAKGFVRKYPDGVYNGTERIYFK